MSWFAGLRALGLLRRATVALERQADAQETLARIALAESGLDRKQTKLVDMGTFDVNLANKRYEASVIAKAAGVEP
jgi:hypothetical protein